MWNDLLPNNVHGLDEAGRTALISLGVQKAEYLAEQFMDDKKKALLAGSICFGKSVVQLYFLKLFVLLIF